MMTSKPKIKKELYKISASKLKTFLDCRLKFYVKYVLKLKDQVGEKARLGSAIHEVLEMLADPKKKHRRQKFIDYSIKTESLHPAIKRLFVKTCKKFSVDTLHSLGESLLVKTFIFGFEIHNTIAVEQHFTIPVSARIAINGFIDKVQKITDTVIEISDYKSGQPMNMEACEKDVQPFFYLIAALTLYPEKDILFTFHFLKNHKSCTITPKTKEQLKNFTNFIIAQGMLMQTITARNAKPKPSFKCGYCDFKLPRPDEGYEGCPAFSTFKKDGQEHTY